VNKQPVVVVGSDMDLLVMLVSRAGSTDNIYLLNSGTSKTPIKLYNVCKLQEALGEMRGFSFCMPFQGAISHQQYSGKSKGHSVPFVIKVRLQRR